jgi:hypothetical protein
MVKETCSFLRPGAAVADAGVTKIDARPGFSSNCGKSDCVSTVRWTFLRRLTQQGQV